MKDITKYFKKKTENRTSPIHIIAGLVLLGMAIYLYRFDYGSFYTSLQGMNTLTWIMFIMAALLSFVMARQTIMINGLIDSINIFSLKDEIRNWGKLKGAFFLGCGTVTGSSGQQDYYVFYKEGDFGLIKDKIKCDNVEVIMTNKVKPSLKRVMVEEEEITALFVPKNTIKRKITLS